MRKLKGRERSKAKRVRQGFIRRRHAVEAPREGKDRLMVDKRMVM
jgi:hypothetical protein